MSKALPRNGETWSEARFTSFIKSALRGARWGPRYKCIQLARVGHGLYECASCGTVGPPTLPPEAGKKRRIKNIVADHIQPVVDPNIGFVDWNTFIARLFVEQEGWQALCNACHTIKTSEENTIAKERRQYIKEQQL